MVNFAKLKNLGNDLLGRAGELAEQAKEKAGPLAEQAKEKAGDFAGQAKEKAGPLAEKARDAAVKGYDKAVDTFDSATNRKPADKEGITEVTAGVDDTVSPAAPEAAADLPLAESGFEPVVLPEDPPVTETEKSA